MVTSHPLTHAYLTLPEAQEVIDNIFPSPASTPISGVPQSIPLHTLPHPGRITHLTELSSGRGTFNTCYLLHFPLPPAKHSTATFTQLVLKIAPPPNIRLLRYESTPTPLLAIEAYLLDHLTTNQPSLPVPRVLAYDDTLTLLDSPFLLTTFLPGVPLSEIRPALTEAQAGVVDFEVGRLLRGVNEVRAGGGAGGWGGVWGMVGGKPGAGAREWVGEFVEGLLRDGEDMRVLLPYEDIRRAIGKWGGSLDAVGVGSLEMEMEYPEEEEELQNRNDDDDNDNHSSEDVLDEPPHPHSPKLCILDFSDASILLDPSTYRITGLIDFERAFWGDPIAQDIFLSKRADVIRGYNSLSMSLPKNKKTLQRRSCTRRMRRCRELLYTILSSTTKILQRYYRQIEPDHEEMVQRKRLVDALAELARMPLRKEDKVAG